MFSTLAYQIRMLSFENRVADIAGLSRFRSSHATLMRLEYAHGQIRLPFITEGY